MPGNLLNEPAYMTESNFITMRSPSYFSTSATYRLIGRPFYSGSDLLIISLFHLSSPATID
jgi:hypothetical protein